MPGQYKVRTALTVRLPDDTIKTRTFTHSADNGIQAYNKALAEMDKFHSDYTVVGYSTEFV